MKINRTTEYCGECAAEITSEFCPNCGPSEFDASEAAAAAALESLRRDLDDCPRCGIFAACERHDQRDLSI